MTWTIKHKTKDNPKPKPGDRKVKKHFCIFPKAAYDFSGNYTTYYWLTTVYIGYEWVRSEQLKCFWSIEVIPAHWQQIGIVKNYSTAIELGWC